MHHAARHVNRLPRAQPRAGAVDLDLELSLGDMDRLGLTQMTMRGQRPADRG